MSARAWPEPPGAMPSDAAGWWALRARAERIYQDARSGRRRRSPRWVAYRHRWKAVRDLARRHTDGDLSRPIPTPAPVRARDVAAVAVAAVAGVLALPAVALLGIAAALSGDRP